VVAEEFPTASEINEASLLNRRGLALYGQWEMDRAIQAFRDAAANDPDNPEYYFNLARAYTRAGDYANARHSLADYLQSATDEAPTDYYQRLFTSALDAVESRLIEGMAVLEMPVQLAGKAFQMWLEYRLTTGRQPILLLERPGVWASALIYLTCTINFVELDRQKVADLFQVETKEMKDRCRLLIKKLDLTTGDSRYFLGDKSPLESVFEAAQEMELLNTQLELE